MEVKDLSSIVTAVSQILKVRGMAGAGGHDVLLGNSNRDQQHANGNESREILVVSPVFTVQLITSA